MATLPLSISTTRTVHFKNDHTGEVKDFTILPNATAAQIMNGVLELLKLTQYAARIAFYNQADEERIVTFSSVKSGDTILVHVCKLQNPYAGMSRTEKRDAIKAKFSSDAPPEEKCEGVEITMSPEDIYELLEKARVTPIRKLKEELSPSSSLQTIEENWGVDLDTFPPPHDHRDFRPLGKATSWDPRLLAYLAVLSEFTPGQGEYMATLLNTVVEARNSDRKVKNKSWVLAVVDVRKVVNDLLVNL